MLVASGTYEKNSLDWQLQLWWQQLSEWLDRLLQQTPTNRLPQIDWQLPDAVQRGLFWVMVFAVMSWAGWQLYRLLQPYWVSWWLQSQPLVYPSTTAQTPSLSIAEWLNRSHLAQQQGNYREACRALYMATLQHLSDRDLIPPEPSRTDGEYLQLLHAILPAHPYQVLIQAHEQICFSDAPVAKGTFDRCWQAYQQVVNG